MMKNGIGQTEKTINVKLTACILFSHVLISAQDLFFYIKMNWALAIFRCFRISGKQIHDKNQKKYLKVGQALRNYGHALITMFVAISAL